MNLVHMKKALVFVIITALTVFLAACGGANNNANNANNTNTAPAENVGKVEDATPAAPVAPAVTNDGKLGANFEEIVAKAQLEKKLVYASSLPTETAFQELWPAFEKRFGLSGTEVEILNVHPRDVPVRIVAEKTADKYTIDLSAASEGNLGTLTNRDDLLMEVDWVNLFGQQLPRIEYAASAVSEPFIGKGLEFVHLVYGIGYNTNLIKKEDLPKLWVDLADPVYKGKFAIDVAFSPLARLSISLDEMRELAPKIKDNTPIYAEGTPAVVQKVVAGEAAFGISAQNVILSEKAKGAPVEMYFPEPFPEVNAQVLYIPSTVPHPNMSVLFAAWMSTEGMEILAKYGEGRARNDEPGPYGDYLRENNIADPKRPTTAEEVKETTDKLNFLAGK